MVQVNFARREVNCKLVFYGCGMCGKTTNLQMIHEKAPKDKVGNLTSISTEQDRTLFFDFMPLDLGSIAGMRTKFNLYTVPGQVYYASTRKLVLQGVDGVVFVVDSGPDRVQDNIDSLKDLDVNLKEYGLSIDKVPLVIQYNKRDLPNAVPLDELKKAVDPGNKFASHEAVAFKGEGVMQTLKVLAGLVIEKLNQEYGSKGSAIVSGVAKPSSAPAPTPTAAPAPVAVPVAIPVAVASAPPPRPAPSTAPAPAPVRPAPVAAPAPRPQVAPPAPAPVKAAAPAKKGCGGQAAVLLGILIALAAALGRFL